MPGPETKEAPKEQGSLKDKLEELHAQGILLSDEAANELTPGTDVEQLERMASQLKKLEELRGRLKGKPSEVTAKDFDYVEGELRRVNSLGEIDSKLEDMHHVYMKYLILKLAITKDGLNYVGRSVPPKRARFRPEDIAKVHQLPLKQAIRWEEVHEKRVELLNKLTDEKIVPTSEYENFRRMDAGAAYAQLRAMQRNYEEKEHASADSTLDQDLNKMA